MPVCKAIKASTLTRAYILSGVTFWSVQGHILVRIHSGRDKLSTADCMHARTDTSENCFRNIFFFFGFFVFLGSRNNSITSEKSQILRPRVNQHDTCRGDIRIDRKKHSNIE